MASHTALAERFGATKEEISHLLDFENGPFDEKEKAALRFALKMTRAATKMTDAEVADLRRYFDEGEIVEICAVVGFFNYVNRLNDALGMEPTKPGEGLDT